MQHLACVSGIVNNISFDQNYKYGKADNNYYALPYMNKVKPGDQIVFSNGYIMLYRKDFVYLDYWSGGSINSPRTITVGNNLYLIRFAIQKTQEKNVYVKNNTTGEYLYKGENVT